MLVDVYRTIFISTANIHTEAKHIISAYTMQTLSVVATVKESIFTSSIVSCQIKSSFVRSWKKDFRYRVCGHKC